METTMGVSAASRVVEDELIKVAAKRKLKFKRPEVEQNQKKRGNPECLPANVVVNGNRKHGPGAF
jgi:hypothetical protein